MSIISSIRIRRIYVEPLTQSDIDTGITDAASAEFTIAGKAYQVPKSGAILTLDLPMELSVLTKTTKVKVWMYDRQPSKGDQWFTVSFPSNPKIIDGNLDLVVTHTPQPIVYGLRDAQEFVDFLTKQYTDQELRKLLPWCQGWIHNKESLLSGFDD